MAWYFRWSMMLPFMLAALGLVWFAYNSGLEFAGFHRGETQQELSGLQARLAVLSEQNTQLGRKVAQFEQQIQIEQGRSQEMARQMKSLNDDNARLQEDLSFFQNLTAENGKEGELAIHRMSRVRMLLVQSGQRVKEFTGSYQLVATVVQNGRKMTQLFPSDESGYEQFMLNFKYYKRLEQSLRFPADVQLQNIQVRLFEHGVREPRARQSVDLS
jgi:hypothetical protein